MIKTTFLSNRVNKTNKHTAHQLAWNTFPLVIILLVINFLDRKVIISLTDYQRKYSSWLHGDIQYLTFYDNLSCWGHLFICHSFPTFKITHRMALLNLYRVQQVGNNLKEIQVLRQILKQVKSNTSPWCQILTKYSMYIHTRTQIHTQTYRYYFWKTIFMSPCISLCTDIPMR